MIRADSILGQRVHGVDGASALVRDLYFDDRTWQVRHLILHQHGPFEVAVAPHHLRRSPGDLLQLGLTAEELSQSPFAGTILPVCKQYARTQAGGRHQFIRSGDPSLRSVKIIMGYAITGDGFEGARLVNLSLDEETWSIREVMSEMPDGSQVQILPSQIGQISFTANRAYLKSQPSTELASSQKLAANFS